MKKIVNTLYETLYLSSNEVTFTEKILVSIITILVLGFCCSLFLSFELAEI